MNPRALSRLRLGGLLRKETLQILRDPSSILLALVLPVAVLFLVGYGLSLDADNVPVALVLEDGNPLSRELAARFQGSRSFEVRRVTDFREAERRLRAGSVDGIITVPRDFAARLGRGAPAPVQLVLNGIDANRARLVRGYAGGVLREWARFRAGRGAPAAEVRHRIWFNEAARSTVTIVPGLIALIMTLTGTLLTALVIAREWERGTMEAVLATPMRTGEFLLAKVVPYFLLGMGGMALTVLAALTLFGVPLRGSCLALALVGSLFMLASLGLGLAFSAAIRVQFVSAMASIVAGFLPAVFLSGLLFDLQSTPAAVRLISYIVPARYFVSASRTVFLAGNVWPLLLKDAAALLVMSVLLLAVARLRLGKRLEV